MTTRTESIIPAEFQDIAPYDDWQYREKIGSLVKEPGFEHAVKYIFPNIDYEAFCKKLLQVSNRDEFQREVMGPFLETLVQKTTSGLTCDGLENIPDCGAYTFITNHRDIVLDASFLNLNFIRHGHPLTQVAIGNNLLIYEWITDLVKLNRSFIVKRDGEIRTALDNARQLSGYIHYVINERHEPVWIAQREGRAKDSNDLTQESLIKMIGLAPGSDVKENILGARLNPVSITYEYDPNDYLKAREFLLRRRDPDFKKSQHDDLLSMETGLLKFKGRVHMHVGKCINAELEKSDATSRQEVIREACRLIDKSVHSGYKIYPCNYIAYDELEGNSRFAGSYSAEDVASFDAYINGQLDKVDVPDVTAEERDFMRGMMLNMYANPLRNQLAANAD